MGVFQEWICLSPKRIVTIINHDGTRAEKYSTGQIPCPLAKSLWYTALTGPIAWANAARPPASL